MPENTPVELRLPAEAAFIPIASFAAGACARTFGFSQEDAERISLAAEEAMAGAISLGYGGPDDVVELSILRTSLGIEIVLRSRGLPLEREELPVYDPTHAVRSTDVTGLGDLFIDRMMDKVSFSTSDSGHRELRMEKLLPATSVQQDMTVQSEEPLPPRSVCLSIRLAEVGDAEGISRLALHAHDALMFNEHIYYPRRVREMLRSGEMISVVAEGLGGELAGHGALVVTEPGSRIAELTYGFVSPRYRGQRCATKIAALLMENALQRGVTTVQSLAVTNHVHSQRSLLHMGFSPAGLLLAASPASRQWRRVDGDTPGRISNMVFFKRLPPSQAVELYVPPRHRDIIHKIYENLGISVEIATTDTMPPVLETEARLKTVADLKEGWAWMVVQKYGRALKARIATQLHQACSHGLKCILLLLPLDDPATPRMCETFEAMGFFFAGAGPAEECGDGICLQYLNGVHPGYATIHVLGEFAQELKEYVRSCDSRRC
jgi:serine/threonine-protein kinase RsbW